MESVMQTVIDNLFELVLVLDLIIRGTSDEGARAVAVLAKRDLWKAAQALDDIGFRGGDERTSA
jgi:hypothetical protein